MSGVGEKDEARTKDEEIFKLRKLAAIFKSECKKLKEENDALKRGSVLRGAEAVSSSSSGNTTAAAEQLKNEYAKRLAVEKSYKKLKNFTLMLEEKMTQIKSESKKRYDEMEEKLKGCQNDLSVSQSESEKLRKTIQEKETTMEKLRNKMDQFKSYLKEHKGMTDMAENSINQAVEYKMQIKKLKEHLEGVKKTEEITSKERQQYRSMIMLCSQYKQKCKQLPLLENKVEILERKIKELEIFKDRDKEKMENISELRKSLINEQVEKEKLNEQLSEWSNFAKLYIDKNAIDVESLKRSMQQIHEKYTHVNSTKTDLELRYRTLAADMEMVRQTLEDRKLEVKIVTNKNRQLEKLYEFAKQDYMREAARRAKQSTASCKEESTTEGDPKKDPQKENSILENSILEKSLTEYKAKYDFLRSDNEQKEKLIEELGERVRKYQSEFEQACLMQKSAETASEELQLYQKEILILKEEIQNYKNRIVTLEGDLMNVTNEWNDDKEKYEKVVNDLREAVRKAQFDSKISGSAGSSSNQGGTPQEVKKQHKEEEENDAHNTLNALYSHLDGLSSVDEIELVTLRNENLYLKSKIEVVKIFYENQIKSYREAFLYILGWDIQIEQNDQDIFFILTSLFSTHDGKFIFIKSNGAKDKRSLGLQPDEERLSKRVKRQGWEAAPLEEIAPVEVSSQGSGNQDNQGNKENRAEQGTSNDEAAPREGLTNEPDEHTATITLDMSKSTFQNTNVTLSSIVKGSKYSLLLHGHYGLKWNDNEDWKDHINKINTYPVLLSMSCIEEFNNIKAQYSNSMGKNSRGMLFKL
ncbi:hypothetical protein C922_04575 [Plasmodium inui San Antonio 1]|uniref:Uncharacterized protein n=1 Tax=Plasmodium inui San Antonio 1 TaxID=1237626 RepID=W6ZWC0_9APIC|nr:hypothetical protein C922_04575 [Plasmodium inui San Antonio 1]EUD65062.1 hypothetical protein C922_04575 [Plasmodium inui San Antonio 1]